jgi:hypothetical protein
VSTDSPAISGICSDIGGAFWRDTPHIRRQRPVEIQVEGALHAHVGGKFAAGLQRRHRAHAPAPGSRTPAAPR